MATIKNSIVTALDTMGLPSGTTAQRPTAIYSTPGTYTWTCPAGVTSVDILVVGGGGAGGSNLAGGGGAGGVVYQLTATVVPTQGYTVVVGAGGINTAPGTQAGVAGVAGGNSSFSGSGFTTITAAGGGGGGAGANNIAATSGGSGGGGGGYSTNAGASSTGNAGGTARYGNAGGSGVPNPSYGGGGGGGAGGAGGNASNPAGGAAGGAGINIPAFGAYYWGGGGGGAAYTTGNAGAGGIGGGGGGSSGGGSTYPGNPDSATVQALGGNNNGNGFTRGISLGIEGGFHQAYLSEAQASGYSWRVISGGHGGECTGSGGGGGNHNGYVGGFGGNGYVLIRWVDRGAIRYNTDYQVAEYFDGALWKTLDKRMIAYSTGAEIRQVSDDIVHIWSSIGTHYFYPQYTGDVRVLVVGGGGSGGTSNTNCSAGGGGAGQFIERQNHTVIASNTYTITVGAGGLGGVYSSQGSNSFLGNTGTLSQFAGPAGASPLLALPGGGGGGGQTTQNGKDGGSSGGAAWGSVLGSRGQNLAQGSPFGDGGRDGGNANSASPNWGGGGGGGASERGLDGQGSYNTGLQQCSTGGGGRSSSITGETRFYAGGGGGAGCTGSSSNIPGTGGIGGGGASYYNRGGGNGSFATGGGGGAGTYTTNYSGDGGSGIVVVRYPGRPVTIGNSQSNPALSAAQIKSYNPQATTGLYWIIAGGYTQQVYCDMEHDGGGWMLVSSNDARDTTIAGGTGRYSQGYELDRPSVSLVAGGNALVGTVGIDPNGDYIIGGIINSLPFSEVRVWGWGRNSTNNTYRWPDNLGVWAKARWGLTTTGSSRLTEVRARQYVYMSGNSHGTAQGNGQSNGILGTTVTPGGSAYFVMDSIKQDRINGGYTANSNQITVGGAGVSGASGDPTTGCYFGHGATEGSFEGWYDNGYTNNQDCQGWATWVR